jgi:hypothetical protein
MKKPTTKGWVIYLAADKQREAVAVILTTANVDVEHLNQAHQLKSIHYRGNKFALRLEAIPVVQ